MSMSDPIADMLARIRNALQIKRPYVDVPSSQMKMAFTKILREEGYIKAYKYMPAKPQGIIRLYLKYGDKDEPVMHKLQRVSKPGRRVYVAKDRIPRVFGGLGIAVVSTSKGLMSDRKCRRLGIGGEHLCNIW